MFSVQPHVRSPKDKSFIQSSSKAVQPLDKKGILDCSLELGIAVIFAKNFCENGKVGRVPGTLLVPFRRVTMVDLLCAIDVL